MIRRPRRRDGDEFTGGELAWARGDWIPDEDRATVVYFTSGERLRAVWEHVHGAPIEEHLLATTEEALDISGQVWVNGAVVGRLAPDAARALVMGIPFEWE